MQEEAVKELSIEELEAQLAKRKKKAAEERQKEREVYDKKRDTFVNVSVMEAIEIHVKLKEFKELLHGAFEEHAELLNNYGGIRSNSKGGFSLVSTDGQTKVTRLRSTMPSWDEKSTKAIELINDFLKDTVKKRDQKLFEILISFIQKNEKGDLEYGKVMTLFQHREKYNDPRWREGLALLQESYKIQFRGYGYRFQRKDKEGKWEEIDINFNSL